MISNFFIDWNKKCSGPDITDQWIHKYNHTEKSEALFISQKYFSVAAMLHDLNEDGIEMNLRKKIDELLLQANMVELKKAAAIVKIGLDKEEHLQMCQLLTILQTHEDKVNNLVAVSRIKQTFLDMMQTKTIAQQTKGGQNGTAAVGKNIAEHILGAVGFGGEESAFHKDFKISEVIGEAGQKDKLS